VANQGANTGGSSNPIARGRASAVIPAGLTLANISKKFGDKTVLHDINLDIKPAEVICLLGNSGCGKTTLLRVVAGMEDPSSGQLTIDGRLIADASNSLPSEQRGIGMVFQDYALFPHMTVTENIIFGLRGLNRQQCLKVAAIAMSRVGLTAMAEAYPYMLSGGEQQRVALARAIVPRPRILLMDEPFSNLDSRMRDSVREDTIGLLRETRATCIMVTHEPEEAMQIADRIVLMRDGRIVQSGAPEDIYNHPKDLLVARFFCDLNEFPCTIQNGEASCILGRFSAKGLPNGAGTVCVRPTGFNLLPQGQGLSAMVQSSRFIGVVHRCDISLQGHDRLVHARIREMVPFRRNREVGLAIDSKEVLVFASQPA
jgi:iron(III) transport system ATP-binding protein